MLHSVNTSAIQEPQHIVVLCARNTSITQVMIDRNQCTDEISQMTVSQRIGAAVQAYFRINYFLVVVVTMVVCMVLNPASLIVLGMLAATWFYLFVARQAPITIGGRAFRCATCISLEMGCPGGDGISRGNRRPGPN